MRMYDSLGSSGGTRRIQNHCWIVLLNGRQRDSRQHTEAVLELQVIQEELSDAGHMRTDFFKRHVALSKIYGAAAVFEHVLDLSSLHSRVNRHCNCAGKETGEIRDRNLGAIVQV